MRRPSHTWLATSNQTKTYIPRFNHTFPKTFRKIAGVKIGVSETHRIHATSPETWSERRCFYLSSPSVWYPTVKRKAETRKGKNIKLQENFDLSAWNALEHRRCLPFVPVSLFFTQRPRVCFNVTSLCANKSIIVTNLASSFFVVTTEMISFFS